VVKTRTCSTSNLPCHGVHKAKTGVPELLSAAE
jgi:hypothetical protein